MTKDELILAQQARIEQLHNFIKHAQVSSGVCCCGDSMEGHPSPMTCGHTPVDMWDYHSAKLLEAAPADLSSLRAHDEKMLAATTPAAKDVLAERQRQQSVEGWTPEHDDQHRKGEMAAAAGCYALFSDSYPNAGQCPGYWPWYAKWWKPSSYRRNLIKAGALILAEIERFDRADAIEKGGE